MASPDQTKSGRRETDDLPSDFERDLRDTLEGEVMTDQITRGIYATDASMYRVMPIGVCYPANRSDAETAVRMATEAGVPVLPRGGGTSLAGQTVGRALIMDFSRHMNRVLRVDPGSGTAVVEPGTVLDDLNRQTAEHGLTFGPDVATHNRATIGGMMGNNSAGARSIAYGQTVDHVKEVRAILSGGKQVLMGPAGPGTERPISDLPEPERSIANRLFSLASDHREEINRQFPDLLRNVAGYALDRYTGKGRKNLADVFVGSEGTLGVASEITVNLVEKPPRTVLGAVHFENIWDALGAVKKILRTEPRAVELVDKFLLDLAAGHDAYAEYTYFLSDEPEAVLLVEYAGSSRDRLNDKLTELEELTRNQLSAYSVAHLVEPSDQQAAWKVREGGLGIVMSMKGDAKPTAFVEDAAVPVEHLADFGRDFRRILNEHHLDASFYGHASVGLLHIRPILNLKEQSDIDKLQPVTQKVAKKAANYGGTYSGEHGEGRARSWLRQSYFGEEINQLFRKVKTLFDPDNLMNPGTLVDPGEMDQNLRYGPDYRTLSERTYLRHAEQGGLQRSIEFCNGNGLCRKTDAGTMCPSYMVTGKEEDSTRGRANALREVLAGGVDREEITSPDMKRVMDLCIGCKACKSECPSGVDMARLKFEFLCRYNREHGRSIRDLFFGHAPRAARWMDRVPFARSLSRLLSGVGLDASLKQLLQIHPQRDLPRPSGISLFDWYRNEVGPNTDNRPEVRLFVDSFTGYVEPETARSAVRVLWRSGYYPLLVSGSCCGRTYFSRGMYDEWKQSLENCYDQLFGTDAPEGSTPVVVIEPSCYSSLVDDSKYLFSDKKSGVLQENVFLIEEFLGRSDQFREEFSAVSEGSGEPLVHPHCHLRALLGTEPLEDLFSGIPSVSAQILDAGCCGMAGSFGYEEEHYNVSRKMAERRLTPAVARHDGGPVLASGFSCRHQINDFTGQTAIHPVSFLDSYLS